MSSRPIIAPNVDKAVVVNGDMSGSITSAVTIIQMLPGISYDISWTGTPTGTFTVQVSNTYANDPSGTVRTAGRWHSLPAASFSGTYPAPAGSAGQGFLDVVGTEAYAVRIIYTRVSGTGVLNIMPCAKVL